MMRFLASLFRNSSAKRLQFSLTDFRFRQNPYPYYSEMRRHSPVHWFEQHQLWAVTRYEDIVEILKRPDVFIVPREGVDLKTILNADPSDHQRLRKAVSKYFSPQRISSMESLVQDHTNRLLHKMKGRRKFDLISELSEPLSVSIISEFLGISPEYNEQLKHLSLSFILRTNSTPKKWAALTKNKMAIHSFFEQYFKTGVGRIPNGLLSELQVLPDDILSGQELVGLSILFYLAGHVTTTHLIGNAVRAMFEHPDEMKRLRTNSNSIPAFIEETLRYDTPAQMIPRVVLKDSEISGFPLQAGSKLLIVYGSANRDETQFPDPDRFSMDRKVDHHIAFGDGPHYCLGAFLARLEAKVVLEQLLKLPHLQPAQSLKRAQLCDYLYIRGLKRLDLIANTD
jgi:cytochrome P450